MAKALHAIISIHDVSPSNLEGIKQLLNLIPSAHRAQTTLLVIPGEAWQPQDLQQLKNWQQQGYRLAGHGWNHKARSIKGIYHRLHSWLVSRDAAEHLALNTKEIAELLQRNHQWFSEQGLQAPNCYVPPAWAMGKITLTDAANLPFDYYEVTSGIYNAKSQHFIKLPLIGFEADTWIRRILLSIWNSFNILISNTHKPLRISIHPNDHQLLLKEKLVNCLRQVGTAYTYQSIFQKVSN